MARRFLHVQLPRSLRKIACPNSNRAATWSGRGLLQSFVYSTIPAIAMTPAAELRLRFLSVVSGGIVVGSLVPTLGCNTATTKEPSNKADSRARDEKPPGATPDPPLGPTSATAPPEAPPAGAPTAAPPTTGSPTTGAPAAGAPSGFPTAARPDTPPKPASASNKERLRPSCERGSAEVQCFAPGSTHFNVGNVPDPGPPPKAQFDANKCQVQHEVRDSCCVPARTGPAFIDGQCCYGFCGGTCCGRPLLVDGQARVAPVAARADWSERFEPSVAGLDASERAALAGQWLEEAQLEHASIASFARFMLDLLAFGAPAELVERCQRAIGDEIRHARACFGLASAYAGAVLGPGPLDLSGVAPSASLAAAAAAAVREGCVNETVAALTATEQARAATDPALRAILERIARDEAEHAELAWCFVDWALRVGGQPVRVALTSGLRPLCFNSSPAPQEAGLRASGRLTAAERQAIAECAWNEVILPCAEALGA
jgi:hypothetical protein